MREKEKRKKKKRGNVLDEDHVQVHMDIFVNHPPKSFPFSFFFLILSKIHSTKHRLKEYPHRLIMDRVY